MHRWVVENAHHFPKRFCLSPADRSDSVRPRLLDRVDPFDLVVGEIELDADVRRGPPLPLLPVTLFPEAVLPEPPIAMPSPLLFDKLFPERLLLEASLR